jgi:hypothetical protein
MDDDADAVNVNIDAADPPNEPTDAVEDAHQQLSDAELAKVRIRQILRQLDANNVAAARRAIHAQPLPPLTAEARRNIEALFPPRHHAPANRTDYRAATGSVPLITSEKIETYVDAHSKIRKGKDVYGWTIPQLGLVLKGTERTKADGLDPMSGLAKLVNDIVLGRLPADSLRALKRLRGCPLTKPNGGIRPICIEPVFMKMAAALLVQETASDISAALGPMEFGHGKKGSTEALTHVVRTHMSKHTTHVALCVDIRNTFGSISRDLVLEQTKTTAPKLLPLAASLLDTPSESFETSTLLVVSLPK